MTAHDPPAAPRPGALRLHVQAATPPDPARLRAALRARLAGDPFPAGAEADVAEQVRTALARRDGRDSPWR